MTDSDYTTDGGVTPPYKAVKDSALSHPDSRKKQKAKSALLIFLSAFVYSVSFHYFVAPSNFAPGGVGGIVAIVKYIFRVSPDLTLGGMDYSPFLILLVNLPLALLTARSLSGEFLRRTVAESALVTIMLFVLDNFIDPTYVFSVGGAAEVADLATRLIASGLGGVCCGVSLWLALKANASTGGTDIIAAYLQKKNPHKSVAVMIFLVNSVIVLISVFFYHDSLMPVFLAFIYMFIAARTCDTVMYGGKSAVKFEVVTDCPTEIATEIIETLGHGVTVLAAKGMFEQKEHALLVCVMQPRKVPRFKEILSKYPGSFAYIGTVNEIVGKFNRQKD